MSEPVIVNAVIRSTSITIADHGVLSVWLDLDYGGSGQGFGGYVLGGLRDTNAGRHKEQKNLAAEFIVAVLLAAGVEKWDQLPGKTIRVRKTDSWGDILAIGHIVKDNLWFSPKDTFERWTRPGATP